MGAKKKGLTAKQKRFVLEYLLDMNGTAAAVRAGFSPRTAKEIACQLLGKPHVQHELSKRMTDVAQGLEMRIDDVVREYCKIARANITDFLSFGPDGVDLKPSSERTPDELAAIAEVRMFATGDGKKSVALKLHSKTDALNALGKHLGMFVERHDVRVEGRADVRFYLPDNGRRPELEPDAKDPK
jgi:phage terminase small subunit